MAEAALRDAEGKPRRCCGVRRSGYWKGWRCGAWAVVEAHGYGWCRNHLPTVTGEELDEVLEAAAVSGEPFRLTAPPAGGES